jgi:hypothetical protein
VRVWARAARISRVSWSKRKRGNKLRNLRHTQVLERVIRRSQIFVQPPTDTGSSLYYIFLKWFVSRSVLFCPVQHRRSNGWADRAQNWYKHSLELCDEDRLVVDRECALMRALRAQTCAHHHISSIGGQTAGPLEPHIGKHSLGQ